MCFNKDYKMVCFTMAFSNTLSAIYPFFLHLLLGYYPPSPAKTCLVFPFILYNNCVQLCSSLRLPFPHSPIIDFFYFPVLCGSCRLCTLGIPDPQTRENMRHCISVTGYLGFFYYLNISLFFTVEKNSIHYLLIS